MRTALPTELVDLFSEWDHLSDLLRRLDDPAWTAPTPCPGWTVHDVVSHIVGTEQLLCGDPVPDVDLSEQRCVHLLNDIGELNEKAVVTMRPWSRARLLDELDSVLDRRRASLSAMTDDELEKPGWSPIGEVPYRVFMSTRVFDCWVHEQDIRIATGLELRLDGSTGDRSFEIITGALPRIVAKKAAAPEGSRVRFVVLGEQERIHDIVVTDGRAALAAPGDDATTTLTADTATLVLAACGRRAATTVEGDHPAPGEIGIGGDDSLGRRVVENLAFTI